MLNHTINRFIDRQRWLEPVADFLQKVVGGSYKLLGTPGHTLKTFVHGTWLGHPLHPVITDIPIGAWTLAVLFDIIYLFNRSQTWVSAADLTIFVGVLGALGAAVTGYTDWNETVDRERRVGITHGLLNTVVLVVYLVSLIIRVTGGSRGLAIVLAFIGYALVVTAAYLGGDMVFSIGTGVNHHAWQEVPTKFTKVMLEGQLHDNVLVKAMAGDTPILLVKKGGVVCAISETCSHAGGRSPGASSAETWCSVRGTPRDSMSSPGRSRAVPPPSARCATRLEYRTARLKSGGQTIPCNRTDDRARARSNRGRVAWRRRRRP